MSKTIHCTLEGQQRGLWREAMGIQEDADKQARDVSVEEVERMTQLFTEFFNVDAAIRELREES